LELGLGRRRPNYLLSRAAPSRIAWNRYRRQAVSPWRCIVVIRDCKVDEQLLEPFKECMPLPGTEPTEDEWPLNLISSRAVIYSCGRLGRAGEAIDHAHDGEELTLCRRLAREAAALWTGKVIAFSDEGSHYFTPFFATALIGDEVPTHVSEEHVRTAFGGSMRPDSRYLIEPLVEAGNWWDFAGGEEGAPLVPLWRSTIAWFNRAELHGACFVQVSAGYGQWTGGVPASILPILVLALTERGSLVGMYSCVVWT